MLRVAIGFTTMLDPTPRQCEVLATKVARELTYQETAARLGISAQTVRTHLRRLYLRLGVRSEARALVELLRRGCLSLEDVA